MQGTFKEVKQGYFVGNTQVNSLRSIGEVYDGFILNKANEKKECYVKVIRISEEDENIEREIEVLNYTQHPNIVKTLYTIRDNKIIYLFKENEGQILTLEQMSQQLFRRSASIKDDQLIFMAAQLIDCLYFMNQQNIANRDIRLGNIIVKQGTLIPKIFDFGSAKMTEGNEVEQTLDLGQMEFQSPQMVGVDEVDYVDYAKSDIWSLGMTLFFLGEKNFPWRRKIEGYEIEDALEGLKRGIRFQILQDQNLKQLISKMLTYSQDERPNTKELLDQFPILQNVLQQLNPTQSKFQQYSDLLDQIEIAYSQKIIDKEILNIMLNHLIRFFTYNKKEIVNGTVGETAYKKLLQYQVSSKKTILLKRQLDMLTTGILRKFNTQVNDNEQLNENKKKLITLLINSIDQSNLEDNEQQKYIDNLKNHIN